MRPAPAAAVPVLAELSPRELEVLRLLTRGLGNAEIAVELILGEATVKTHASGVERRCVRPLHARRGGQRSRTSRAAVVWVR